MRRVVGQIRPIARRHCRQWRHRRGGWRPCHLEQGDPGRGLAQIQHICCDAWRGGAAGKDRFFGQGGRGRAEGIVRRRHCRQPVGSADQRVNRRHGCQSRRCGGRGCQGRYQGRRAGCRPVDHRHVFTAIGFPVIRLQGHGGLKLGNPLFQRRPGDSRPGPARQRHGGDIGGTRQNIGGRVGRAAGRLLGHRRRHGHRQKHRVVNRTDTQRGGQNQPVGQGGRHRNPQFCLRTGGGVADRDQPADRGQDILDGDGADPVGHCCSCLRLNPDLTGIRVNLQLIGPI